MAQITIEVPDTLAQRLVSVQDRLPEVLARWLDEPPPASNYVHINDLVSLLKAHALPHVPIDLLSPFLHRR